MMANFDLLPHIIFFVLSGLLITGLIPIEWIVPRNRNRVRMPREEISPLPKTASECQSDLREKDRIIQCQRETIERLEHRVAADIRTIKGQRNFIKIKDNILVSKNRLIKELNDDLVESDQHIQNQQWDIESLQTQVEEKDQLLWVVTGSDSCALETIRFLQSKLDGCFEFLAASGPDTSGIDRLEVKYTKILGELSSKLDDAEKRLVKQTADAQEYRACVEKDVPFYIECVKVKDVALRNAEAMLKTSETKLKFFHDELKARLHENTNHYVTDGEAKMDQLNDIMKRRKAYLKLHIKHQSACKAIIAQREDFQSQISTLNNKLQECRGRVSTVNVKILDTETRLSSVVKENEELESKLKTSTQLAEEKTLHLSFARHALDTAISQLKALNSECNAHKLAEERLESALNTSQKSAAETHAALQAQRESTSRYAHQLLKTEDRYKESMAMSITLQGKLDKSSAQVSALQAKHEAFDARISNLSKQYSTIKATNSHLQDKLLFKEAQSEDLRAVGNISKSQVADLEKKLKLSTVLATKLEASLVTVQGALAQNSSDLVETRRARDEAQDLAAAHDGALAEAKDEITNLKARVTESEKACEKLSQLLRQANNGRVTAVNKLDSAMRLAYRLKGQNGRLEMALGEESRAREAAEGYVEVEGAGEEEEEEDGGSDEEDDEYDSEYADDGDDEDEEEEKVEEKTEEKEEEEEFKNVEVIEGREPVEGEEGFQFVETE